MPSSPKAVPIERRGDYVVTMYELEEDVCRRMLSGCTFGRGRVRRPCCRADRPAGELRDVPRCGAVPGSGRFGTRPRRQGVARRLRSRSRRPGRRVRDGVCSSAARRPTSGTRNGSPRSVTPRCTRGRRVAATSGSRSTRSRSPAGSSDASVSVALASTFPTSPPADDRRSRHRSVNQRDDDPGEQSAARQSRRDLLGLGKPQVQRRIIGRQRRGEHRHGAQVALPELGWLEVEPVTTRLSQRKELDQ